MSGFDADWLALRAPADDAARDAGLRRAAAAHASADGALIVDIGGGTGATHRALSPLTPGARWRVIDDDEALLARLPDGVEPVRFDLAADVDRIFAPSPRLVTASAFFDLVSGDWIERFADALAASGAALYAALTYDGREIWSPEPPHEPAALAAFHRDMRRDKGFGPGLGPDAHGALAAALRARGYQVREASSDWRLTRSTDAALIAALAQGGVGAIGDQLADPASWANGRAAAETVMVGHRDLFATPS